MSYRGGIVSGSQYFGHRIAYSQSKKTAFEDVGKNRDSCKFGTSRWRVSVCASFKPVLLLNILNTDDNGQFIFRMWYNAKMKKDIAYRIVVEEHEGVYVSSFPSLPGCHTWGKTFEEAVKNAEEALAIYIETLVANGDEIPIETSAGESVSLGVVVRAPATV